MADYLITPAILIGGAGSRLWPLSRANKPKQFLNLGGKGTMFQDTLSRFPTPEFAPAWLLAGAETLEHVTAQLNSLGTEPAGIIVEPAMRGTAAAVAAISFTLGVEDPQALVLVAPADHFIRNEEAFRAAVRKAAPIAAAGRLVTFGITPTAPETGFGYIAGTAPIEIDGELVGYSIGRNGFREKPDRETAARYVADGCLWNAGIFLFRADAMIEQLRLHAPQTLAAVARSCAASTRHLESNRLHVRPQPEAFADAPLEVSIDVAVMEKTDRAAVVPCDGIGWNDIGSLSAIWEVAHKDDAGNAVAGDVVTMDVKNSLIHAASGRKIVAAHLEDLLIVDTEDALIILPSSKAQSVKQLVGQLKAANASELQYKRSRDYTWGEARIVSSENGQTILTLRVAATRRLTRYSCRSTTETWLVTAGAMSVNLGTRLVLLTPGQSLNLRHGDVISAVAVNEEAHLAIVATGHRPVDLANRFIPAQTGPHVVEETTFGFDAEIA